MIEQRPPAIEASSDPALESHFASPQRQAGDALAAQVALASNNPVVDALLRSVGGLLAVLNEDRQILAVNSALEAALGVADSCALLGLRPGEALDCIHAHEQPAGCGTSRHCAQCGAAIALVAALTHGRPEERLCELKVERDGKNAELHFKVRAAPLDFQGCRLLLLFLQDVTADQRRMVFDRVFFHDLNNLVGSLVGGVMLIDSADPIGTAEVLGRLEEMALRLGREIALQRSITEAESGASGPVLREAELGAVAAEAGRRARLHPKAEGRRLRVEPPGAALNLQTEPTVLARVLDNMLLNALEAVEPGAEVRLWITDAAAGEVVVNVHNPGHVPAPVANRMFQRGNSSKAGTGRGYGTYAMRLFAERVLGGRVSFESSEATGTVFRLHLPHRAARG